MCVKRKKNGNRRTTKHFQRGVAAMVEPMIAGRELTLGVIADADGALQPLPLIEIEASSGLYDYNAKYERDDTRYTIEPSVPDGLWAQLTRQTLALIEAMGIRDLCRADFILNDDGTAYFLEINTMPGFTDHSLVPMAAGAIGIAMPELCKDLVDAAMARTPMAALR